jgi:hypothetical protein
MAGLAEPRVDGRHLAPVVHNDRARQQENGARAPHHIHRVGHWLRQAAVVVRLVHDQDRIVEIPRVLLRLRVRLVVAEHLELEVAAPRQPLHGRQPVLDHALRAHDHDAIRSQRLDRSQRPLGLARSGVPRHHVRPLARRSGQVRAPGRHVFRQQLLVLARRALRRHLKLVAQIPEHHGALGRSRRQRDRDLAARLAARVPPRIALGCRRRRRRRRRRFFLSARRRRFFRRRRHASALLRTRFRCVLARPTSLVAHRRRLVLIAVVLRRLCRRRLCRRRTRHHFSVAAVGAVGGRRHSFILVAGIVGVASIVGRVGVGRRHVGQKVELVTGFGDWFALVVKQRGHEPPGDRVQWGS